MANVIDFYINYVGYKEVSQEVLADLLAQAFTLTMWDIKTGGDH